MSGSYKIDDEVDPAEILANSPLTLLHEYWQSIKPEGRLPGRRAIIPYDIPRILSWVFLVNVVRLQDGKMEFNYRLIGTSNAVLVGKDSTGKRVAEAFEPEVAAQIVTHYRLTVERRRPTFWRTDVPSSERRFIHCYRGLFPLATDGETVDMLAGMLVPVDEAIWS